MKAETGKERGEVPPLSRLQAPWERKQLQNMAADAKGILNGLSPEELSVLLGP